MGWAWVLPEILLATLTRLLSLFLLARVRLPYQATMQNVRTESINMAVPLTVYLLMTDQSIKDIYG